MERPKTSKVVATTRMVKMQVKTMTALAVYLGLSWLASEGGSGAVAFAPRLQMQSASVAKLQATNGIRAVRARQQRLPAATSSLLFMSAYENDADDDADIDDWNALVVAFKIYKASYGNLKVPLRFVIPKSPPWPESAWEMKLGLRVSQIRSTGKYVNNNSERRKTLDDLGFVWRARVASPTNDPTIDKGVTSDQLFDAVKMYRMQTKPEGSFMVPADFTVPNEEPWPVNTRGLPLGSILLTMKTAAFRKQHPEATEQFAVLGLQANKKEVTNDARFQKVFSALKTYREIYGDLLIPQPFVVPSDSPQWAEETWGLRLGARVNAIRSQGTFVKNNPERRQMLDDLGFIWSPPQARRGRKAAGTDADVDVDVDEDPAAVVADTIPAAPMEEAAQVDTEERSPEAGASTMDAINALDDIFGADFGLDSDLDPQSAQPTAPTWGIDGSVNMDEFGMSEEAESPAEEYKPRPMLNETLAAAMKRAEECGIIEKVQDGEHARIVKGKRHKEIPWFNDDFGGEWVFEDVVEALTLYKSFYGDFANLTTADYAIPLQDYDAEMDEFGIPDFDMEIEMDASKRAAAAISRLEEAESAMTEDIIEADILQLQSELSDTDDGTKAVDANWPDYLGGMPLGNIVWRIRDGSLEVKHLEERKAQLDAIGFDWGDPKYFIDIPFEKAMCAMYAYYLVRGDMFVAADFVMPDEDPWPTALAGYELGKAVERVRQLQNFLEAYHVDKVGLLRMIDFVWFPNLAMPIDPNEPEMTSETLLLCAMGHPDYSKMSDVPMGLTDKIIADGPFFETDDPKLWWRKWHNWDYVKDYWYELGRRDNAFVLRRNGYPQMAAEHEEKYGPGLFQQIDETLKELEDSQVALNSDTGKDEMLQKLKYFRTEMTGCTDLHPKTIEKMLEDIDTRILELVTGNKGGSVQENLEAAMVAEYEEESVADDTDALLATDANGANGEGQEVEYEYYGEEYEGTEEEDESDVDSSLGLQ